MVLATTATMAITGITHHTPEDSEMLALTRHTTRYRPCHPDQSNNNYSKASQHPACDSATLGDRRRRQSRESVYLRRAQPNTLRRSERGRLVWHWRHGRQAQANRQTSAGLALLSRKLDYTTADPPKLRPGLVSARERRYSPFARNGPAQGHAFCSRPSPVTAPVSSF